MATMRAAPRFVLTQPALKRMVVFGSAWGLALAAGLAAIGWSQGTLCLDDVVLTTVLSVVAGIGTIGPLAAFGSVRASE
jgi:hypothetical protein